MFPAIFIESAFDFYLAQQLGAVLPSLLQRSFLAPESVEINLSGSWMHLTCQTPIDVHNLHLVPARSFILI